MSIDAMAKRIGFLCSGNGHIFRKICEAVGAGILESQIVACIIDRPCPSESIAAAHQIPVIANFRDAFPDRIAFSNSILEHLIQFEVDVIGLTFDSLLEGPLLEKYRNRMLNVHPALLPAFPGLNAVRKAKCSNSLCGGATIHLVDGEMDHGPIISQAVVPIDPGQSLEAYDEQIFRCCYQQLIQSFKWFEQDRVSVDHNKAVIKNGQYGVLPFMPALEIPALKTDMDGSCQ